MKEPALSFQRSKEYWKRKNITYQDYLDLEKLAKTPHSMSAEMATYEDDISYKDKELTKEIKIYGATFWSLRHHQFLIDYGRSITDDDIRFNRKVVILGPDIVDILFPYEYPIGKKIKMEGIEHLVIGVTGKFCWNDFQLLPSSNEINIPNSVPAKSSPSLLGSSLRTLTG